MIYIDVELKHAWKKAEYPRNIINFIIFSHGRSDLTLDEIVAKVHEYGYKMKWEE